MSIIKEIKKYILCQNIVNITIPAFCVSVFCMFVSMFNFNIKYFILSIIVFIILGVVGMISEQYIKVKRYQISEILYFMSQSEKNKKQGIKLLISQNSILDLIENMEVIQKVTENNDWIIENIDKKQINTLLKSKIFVDYLKTLEYEKVKKYIDDSINIMDYESKDGDYKYFIKYLEEKKLIKIEDKIKILQI